MPHCGDNNKGVENGKCNGNISNHCTYRGIYIGWVINLCIMDTYAVISRKEQKMDDMKINLVSELTRGVVSKLATSYLKKKLGIDSLTLVVKNINGTLKDDDLAVRADIIFYASKKEVLEKLKGVES